MVSFLGEFDWENKPPAVIEAERHLLMDQNHCHVIEKLFWEKLMMLNSSTCYDFMFQFHDGCDENYFSEIFFIRGGYLNEDIQWTVKDEIRLLSVWNLENDETCKISVHIWSDKYFSGLGIIFMNKTMFFALVLWLSNSSKKFCCMHL